MALPTKNDPMLSYLTTSFSDHVRIREKFGYKINNAMWEFFQRLGVIDTEGRPTENFGQPLWVYYQFRLAKGDTRPQAEIYSEGSRYISEIESRGVPIAQGYGSNIWDPPQALDERVHYLYDDAKVSLWTELNSEDIQAIPDALTLRTLSKDRKDYVYHPTTGENLHQSSIMVLQELRACWGDIIPDVQVVISDGLNARALTDEGHLLPFLTALYEQFEKVLNLKLSSKNLVVTNGRVRAGYQIGEHLFGDKCHGEKNHPKGIVHIIGERPGTGHHNFSVYLTAQPARCWGVKGKVDHDVTRVVSGISDTAFLPAEAAKECAMIYGKLCRSCPQSTEDVV